MSAATPLLETASGDRDRVLQAGAVPVTRAFDEVFRAEPARAVCHEGCDHLRPPFPSRKLIRVFSTSVFVYSEYIRRTWGQYFTVAAIVPGAESYQTGVVLRKITPIFPIP